MWCKGVISLEFILSDSGNKMETLCMPQPHWPRMVLWILKITRLTANLNTQMSWPDKLVFTLWVNIFAAKKKKNLQTEDKLAKEIRTSVIRKLQATTHTASLRDEWEHLQKYFTISLFCDREPWGREELGIFKFLYYQIQLCVSA